jgi:hypothetical protein
MPKIKPLLSNYSSNFNIEDLDKKGLDKLPNLLDLSAVGLGRATQISIPILYLEPIYSTVTILSALAITSNAKGSYNNSKDNDSNCDKEIGRTQGSYD